MNEWMNEKQNQQQSNADKTIHEIIPIHLVCIPKMHLFSTVYGVHCLFYLMAMLLSAKTLRFGSFSRCSVAESI